MALQLPAALEQRLAHLATEVHRSPDELAQEAVEVFVASHEEFLAAIKEADEEFERGEFLSHKEVVAIFEKRFNKA